MQLSISKKRLLPLAVGLSFLSYGIYLAATHGEEHIFGAVLAVVGLGWIATSVRKLSLPVESATALPADSEFSRGTAVSFWVGRWPRLLLWTTIGVVAAAALDTIGLIVVPSQSAIAQGGRPAIVWHAVIGFLAPNVLYPGIIVMEVFTGAFGASRVPAWRRRQCRFLPLWAMWLSLGASVISLADGLIKRG